MREAFGSPNLEVSKFEIEQDEIAPFNKNFESINRRLGIVILICFAIYPLLLLMTALNQKVSGDFLAIHGAMFFISLAFYYLCKPKNQALIILVTHPFWIYSFSLFAYAVAHWKSPESDLYAPRLSSAIALVALLASVSGFWLMRLLSLIFRLPRMRPQPTTRDSQALGFGLIIISMPLVLLPILTGGDSFGTTVSGLFQPMIILGFIIYCAGRGMTSFVSPAFILFSAPLLMISLLLNGRAALFSILLVIALCYLAASNRPITTLRLIAFYLTLNAVNAFSDTTLSARISAGHEKGASIAISSLFSLNFLLAILGLDSMSDASFVVNQQLYRHDRYMLYMFDGRLGIFERMTQLPHMDIVMARLAYPPPVSWSEIANTFMSALPSFGQNKDLFLDDRLVWSTGLMAQGNIGHPLVTAAGELYAMGGFGTLFILFSIMIGVTLYLYEISVRIFADQFVASVALLCFAINMVTTSTAVSAFGVPMRVYPFVLLSYPVLKWIWALVGPKKLSRDNYDLGNTPRQL